MEHIHNTLTVPCRKSKMVSFASSIIRKIIAPSAWSRFAVNLSCWVTFGSTSSACCLLKSIAIILP